MASKKNDNKTGSKRSSKKTVRPLTPAVRYLRYELTNSGTPGTETSHYLDLARDISACNRRLYRQGRDYHVRRVTIVSSNTIAGYAPSITDPNGFNNAGRVSFACLPDSWTVRNAWKRGFKVWSDQNKIATEQLSGNIQGTWADFKVYMSQESRVASIAGDFLIPKDNGGNNVNFGEWAHSILVSPDGTTGDDPFDLHMLGTHLGSSGAYTTVSLVKSYAESRATVQTADPSVPTIASADPLINVFDYGTTIDEVVDLIEDQNDYPPYEQPTYPGEDGNMPKPLVVQDTVLSDGRSTVGGFNAICGLVEIETTSPIASDVYSVLVELAPGNYRGIKAGMI